VDHLERGLIPWAPAAKVRALRLAVLALPDQDRPRPDPVYRLVALSR
jgi:hypothetical protein